MPSGSYGHLVGEGAIAMASTRPTPPSSSPSPTHHVTPCAIVLRNAACTGLYVQGRGWVSGFFFYPPGGMSRGATNRRDCDGKSFKAVHVTHTGVVHQVNLLPVLTTLSLTWEHEGFENTGILWGRTYGEGVLPALRSCSGKGVECIKARNTRSLSITEGRSRR